LSNLNNDEASLIFENSMQKAYSWEKIDFLELILQYRVLSGLCFYA
jgi:hypothetical protein